MVNPLNLVRVRCDSFIEINNAQFSTYFLNPRSIRNKTADIHDHVCKRRVDVLAITKTWLKSTDDAIRSELCPDGYRMLDCTCTERTGGGTALLFRDSITVKNVGGGVRVSLGFLNGPFRTVPLITVL